MNWAKLWMFVFAFVFPHSACSSACPWKHPNYFYFSENPLSVLSPSLADCQQTGRETPRKDGNESWSGFEAPRFAIGPAMVGSHLPFAGTTRLRAAHRVSPVMVTSLPGVGTLQSDGYICSCRKTLSPSQNNLCKPSLCFCQGSCPRRLVWWEGVSVRKDRGKDCIYFLHKGAWGSVLFQDIWLKAQLQEHWKTFTSFISLVEGTQNKK